MKAVKVEINTLKEKMKKNKQKETEIRRRELRNAKVRFPTHKKCVPIYSHSAHCCSHILRLLSQFHITTTYFLHFRSNSSNSFAAKLPKFCIKPRSKSKIGIFEFSEIILSSFPQTLSGLLKKHVEFTVSFEIPGVCHRKLIGCLNCVVSEDHVNVYAHTSTHYCVFTNSMCFLLQRQRLQRIKTALKNHKQKVLQAQVSSVFLACLNRSTSLQFLTGTFIGKGLIISL